MARPPRRRALTAEEQRLWDRVAATVQRTSESAAPTVLSAETRSEPLVPKPRSRPPLLAQEQPAAPRKKHPEMPQHAALNSGDPREHKKVARGRTDIDATLDLHGMRQLEAEFRLRAFLRESHTQRHRVVLVITGKGDKGSPHEPFGDAPRGVLRRRFLEWVEAAPLRQMISSVRSAHTRHGGGGAFYVFLKKPLT